MNSSNEHLFLIRRWYPDAMTTDMAVDRLLSMVESRLGLSPNQIMSADSICCDDLNAIEYPKRAFEMLGPFRLGGLNGFPFAGLTGMGAFAHHVPADGALFVFFGPHIGITKTGRVGFTLRPGQAEPSSCCGAATAAVNKLVRDQVTCGDVSELDYQQNTLEQILLKEKDRVVKAAEPLVEGTEIIYEATEQRIRLLVERTKFACRYVVVMGGF